MEIELSYYNWLLDKAYIYKEKNNQEIYDEVKKSIDSFTSEDEKRFPSLGQDLKYIMRDGVSIDETIALLKNRIFFIEYEIKLLEQNFLIKELHDSYDYLGYVKNGLKEYCENDSNFCEILRVTSELIDNYNNGRYENLKSIYPNLGRILNSDKRCLTRKNVWSYDYSSMASIYDYNCSLIKSRKEEFSSFIQKTLYPEEVKAQNEFFIPIIKQCEELDSCGNFEEINGFKHYIVNCNGMDLHVYLNYHNLYVCKKEIEPSYPVHNGGQYDGYELHVTSACMNRMYAQLDMPSIPYNECLSIARCTKDKIDKFLNEKDNALIKK